MARVFALLIGIDTYPHVGPLAGCVERLVMDQGLYRMRGIFSHRLLERLGNIQIMSSSVTYEELILSLGYEG